MSELKVYHHELRHNEYEEFYLKYEADKVIAELKADYKEACDRLQTANLIKDEQLAESRHHKYKRCLAMAMCCKRKRIDAADYRIPRKKWGFYNKWYNRWLALADKFKETK
jgi:hypothetical protein